MPRAPVDRVDASDAGGRSPARLRTVTGRFAPSPTGPLHVGNLRTALAAWLLARRGSGRFVVRMEDLDLVTASREARGRAARRAGRHRARLGRPGGPPERALRPLRRRHRHARRSRPDVRVLLHAVGRSARRRPAPHGGEVAYPGTCRELTDGRAGRPGARSDRRRCGCARPATPITVDDALARAVHARCPTTSCCAATTACRPTTWPSSSTTPPRASTQVCRGDDLLASSPRQALLQDLLGLPRVTLRPRAARRRRRRRAAGQAPRRGHAGGPRRRSTRRRVVAALAVSLGAAIDGAGGDGRRRRSPSSTSPTWPAAGGRRCALADLQRSWS